MKLAARVLNLARNLFRTSEVERELDAELRDYLAMLTDEKIEAGMSPRQARRQALMEFGGIEQVKEQIRDVRAGVMLDSIARDLRFAVRTLSAAPAFTLVALLSMALGVGCSAAMFSIVDRALIRPLPYADPDQLVRLTDFYPKGAVAFIAQASRTMDVAAFTTDSEFNLSGYGETAHVPGSAVSAGLFRLLGAQARLGSVFEPGENRPGHDRVILLSDSLWRRAFHADSSIVGSTITIDGVQRKVAGIMPPEFAFPTAAAQLWIPYAGDPDNAVDHWAAGFMSVIARLRPGVTPAQARDELRVVIANVIPHFPFAMARNWNSDADVQPLRQAMAGDVRSEFAVLAGAVTIVLAIACVNLASLLLSRASARRKELAVRASLGASRWRIIRQLVTESVVLALAGGALGILLASGILSALRSVLPANAPRLAEAGIDGHVISFALVITLLTGVACGLVPALTVPQGDLAEAMNSGGPRTRRSGDAPLRRWLIGGEVALTVVLVICAGLLIKNLWLLMQVNPGFRAEQILTARLYPDRSVCPDRAACVAFYDDLVRRARTITGVSEVAIANANPFSSEQPAIAAEFEGQPLNPAEQLAPVLWTGAVTPDYFRIVRLPLIAGRSFTRADDATAMPVILISEATARRFWPGENPLGKRLRPVWEQPWRTVVGIVGDVERYGHAADWMSGAIYMPYPQAVGLNRQIPSTMTIVARSAAPPKQIEEQLRELVKDAGRGIPVSEIRTMEAVVSASTSQSRSMMWLFSGFAAAALALVAIGVYGLISYSVARRRHEIGIRIALGAGRGNIYSLILGRSMRYVIGGLAGGLLASLLMTRLMAGFLDRVTTADPTTYATVAFVVLAVAAAAGYLPSRRAVRENPTASLRVE